MERSSVPTTYHDGIVLQAGVVVNGSSNILAAIGFCSVAKACACFTGRPLANTTGYFSGSTYKKPAESGTSAVLRPTSGKRCSNVLSDSFESGAKAAT